MVDSCAVWSDTTEVVAHWNRVDARVFLAQMLHSHANYQRQLNDPRKRPTLASSEISDLLAASDSDGQSPNRGDYSSVIVHLDNRLRMQQRLLCCIQDAQQRYRKQICRRAILAMEKDRKCSLYLPRISLPLRRIAFHDCLLILASIYVRHPQDGILRPSRWR